jgi:hypothetical protein
MELHMNRLGVHVGDVIDHDDKGLKLIDFLVTHNGMSTSAAESWIKRNKNDVEIKALIKPTKFRRSDVVTYTAHGVILEDTFKLMLLLEGPIARAFRAANSDVFTRHLDGDETLDFERLVNAQSTDPIKVALRERRLARNAAAAALAAPMIEPIIEPVAAPSNEPVAAPIPEPVAAPSNEPVAAPIPEPVAAPSAPAMEPPPQVGAPVSYGLPAVGESLVGQRRQREDDDAQFNSEREYRNLDFRQKNVALAQKELEVQEKKILLDEIVRKNKLLDEIVRKNKLLDEKQKEIERLIEKNKAHAPAPQLQRAPAPQPQRAPAPQPQRAPAPQPQRAPAPQLQRAPAPQFNSRAPAPQFNVITILQVAMYLYDESRIRNKMSREDVLKVGTPIAIEYRKKYHKAPEKVHWEGNQYSQNIYYEHHRLLLEQEIIKYDNMKGRS